MEVITNAYCPTCKIERKVVRIGQRPPQCIHCYRTYDEKTWVQK